MKPKQINKSGILVTAALIIIVNICWGCKIQRDISTEEFSPTTPFILGRAIDSQTGTGLENVAVHIDNKRFNTRINGDFDSREKFAIGKYTVKATKDGYHPVFRELIIDRHNEGVIFLVALSMTKIQPPTEVLPEGGIIMAKDGTELHIPSGAISRATSISVTPVLGGGIPWPIPENQFAIHSVALLPSGTYFDKSVTLTVPLTVPIDIIRAGNIKVAYFDTETRQWESVGNANLTPDGTALTVQINHFSIFTFFIDGITNYRFKKTPFVKPAMGTGVIADCTSSGVSTSVAIGLDINLSGSLSGVVASAQIGVGLGFSVTATGSCNRATTTTPKQEVTFKIKGDKYSFDKKKIFGGWMNVGNIKVPTQLVFGCKPVGPCHSSGGGGPP